MITPKIIFAALCTSLLLSSCAVSIYSSYDTAINFSRYKTFAWYQKAHQSQNAEFDNDIIESNVKNFASIELKKRAMFVSVDSPDVLLDYTITVAQKTEQVSTPIYSNPQSIPPPVVYNNGYNNGYGYGNVYGNQYVNRHPYNYSGYNPYVNNVYVPPTPYIVGYKTENIPYEEGTLTIIMIDRKTNRLIWKGWAIGTVTDEQSYEWELHGDIHRIFNQFPLKKVKY